MRGSKNLGCFLIAGFILLAISVSAYAQGFNAWGFSCDCVGDSYYCKLSYDNQLGEGAIVLFLLTDSAGRVVKSSTPIAQQGSGTVGAFFLCSWVQPGTYKVYWKAYRESDESLSQEVAWSKSYETQTITCPCGGAQQPPSLTLFEPEIRGLTVTVNGAAMPGTPGATITRIQWDWGDGYQEDHWFAASHTYSRAGSYTITVTAFQSDGLSTTRTTIANVQAEEQKYTLYVQSNVDAFDLYINDRFVRTEDPYDRDQTIEIYDIPGGTTLTIRLEKAGYRSASRTVTVDRDGMTVYISLEKLEENKPPVADFSYSPSSPKVGETIQFTDKSYDPDGSITAWSWEFGDGDTSTRQNPSHSYSRPGSYDVWLIVTDNKGASARTYKTITVGEENKPPVADFSYSPSSPKVNENVQFTDRSHDSDGYITSWFWDFGDGATSTSQNPSHTYSARGNYNVCLTVTDNAGAQNAACKLVTVEETNRPPYEPSNPYPPHRATEMPVDITLSWSGGDPDGDPVTYDIYFGTSSPPPVLERGYRSTTYRLPVLNYNTKYYWSITASDGKGGYARSTIWEFTTGRRAKSLERVTISGPTEVQGTSGNTANYTCTAYFDDGTREDVTNSAAWSETFASATISRGILTITSDLSSDQRGEVSCSYTYNTATKSASQPATLLAKLQRKVVITNKGNVSDYPSTITAGQSYRCTVRWDQNFQSYNHLVNLWDVDKGTILDHKWTDELPAGSYSATFTVSLPNTTRTTWNLKVEVIEALRSGEEYRDSYSWSVRISGTQGNLVHFDLDYQGTPPNFDGNNQHSVTVPPGTNLTLFFRYNEGNAGNQYVIRVYPEWDESRFIANSDNDETTSEAGQEIGGYRWDREAYTVPTTPGTYRVRVVYSASATPPTWDRYDGLLAEGTITVSRPAIIPTSLSIALDPSSIRENTKSVIKVRGQLTRGDTGQGISGKSIIISIYDRPEVSPRAVLTNQYGYYELDYTLNLPQGSYTIEAVFAGDSEFGKASNAEVLRVEEKSPILHVYPTELDFGKVIEQPKTLQLYIKNNGGGTLEWQAKITSLLDITWLSISRASGSTTTGTDTIEVTADPRSAKQSGSYNAEIEITSNGGTAKVSVLAFLSHKRTGDITVYVRNANTGAPIPRASVHLILGGAEAPGLVYETDQNGSCRFSDVPPGQYELRARASGYEEQRKSGIEVRAGETTTAEFKLRPTIVPLPDLVIDNVVLKEEGIVFLTFSILITVKNIGAGDAESSFVYVNICGVEGYGQQVKKLKANESLTIKFTPPHHERSMCFDEWIIEVDWGNAVQESDEENNRWIYHHQPGEWVVRFEVLHIKLLEACDPWPATKCEIYMWYSVCGVGALGSIKWTRESQSIIKSFETNKDYLSPRELSGELKFSVDEKTTVGARIEIWDDDVGETDDYLGGIPEGTPNHTEWFWGGLKYQNILTGTTQLLTVKNSKIEAEIRVIWYQAAPPSTSTPVEEKTIEEAIASLVPRDPANVADPDIYIGDQEINKAMEFWTNGSPVPGTGGKTIDDATMRELVQLWASQIPVRKPSSIAQHADNVVAFRVESIKLFPNPVTNSGKVILRANGTGIAAVKIEIFNLAGAKVFEQEASGNTLEFYAIDNTGRPLANGVYFYIVTIKGLNGRIERISVKKLTILR